MSYHNKIMNLVITKAAADLRHEAASDVDTAYASGFRDARHAAAEIATEADRLIKDLRESADNLLLLIRHETNLPESARNGVTDSTGTYDEGEVMATNILENARAALASAKEKGFE